MEKIRGCDNKNYYDTWFEAANMAAIQREYSRHANIYEYKCRFCNGYHIGHRRKNGNKVVRYKRKPPE